MRLRGRQAYISVPAALNGGKKLATAHYAQIPDEASPRKDSPRLLTCSWKMKAPQMNETKMLRALHVPWAMLTPTL